MAVLSTRVSLIPDATAYMIAMCQASGAGLADVTVIESPISDEELQRDLLVFGDSTTTQVLAHFGVTGLKRTETALINVAAFVHRENTPISEIVARAHDMFSRFDALLEADWTLGGLCELATLQPKQLRKMFAGQAREVFWHAEVEIIGRVS